MVEAVLFCVICEATIVIWHDVWSGACGQRTRSAGTLTNVDRAIEDTDMSLGCRIACGDHRRLKFMRKYCRLNAWIALHVAMCGPYLRMIKFGGVYWGI